MYGGKKSNLRTLSREYDCLAKIGIRKRSRCYWETKSKGNMSRFELTIKGGKKMKQLTFCCRFWLNWQIWISFNDCDDICDPK